MSKITPHKGGRTVFLPKQRATPEVRAMYDAICKAAGESGADLYERLIRAEYERIKETND